MGSALYVEAYGLSESEAKVALNATLIWKYGIGLNEDGTLAFEGVEGGSRVVEYETKIIRETIVVYRASINIDPV